MIEILAALLVSATTEVFKRLFARFGKEMTELATLSFLFLCTFIAATIYTFHPGVLGYVKVVASIYLMAIGWFEAVSRVLAPVLALFQTMGAKKQ